MSPLCYCSNLNPVLDKTRFTTGSILIISEKYFLSSFPFFWFYTKIVIQKHISNESNLNRFSIIHFILVWRTFPWNSHCKSHETFPSYWHFLTLLGQKHCTKFLVLLRAFTNTRQCTGMQTINTNRLKGLLSSTKIKYIRLKFGPRFMSYTFNQRLT